MQSLDYRVIASIFVESIFLLKWLLTGIYLLLHILDLTTTHFLCFNIVCFCAMGLLDYWVIAIASVFVWSVFLL